MSLQSYHLYVSEKWLKGYALKKWESTLDLCVHAHGYDVQLVMKASCEDNYPLWCKFFCTYDPPFHLRVLPLWYLEDIIPLHYILMIFDEAIPFPVLATPWFWVVVNREHRLPFAPPPLLLGDVAIRLHSLETSRHNVSWSSLTFLLLPCVCWIPDEKYHPCPFV